MPTILSDTYDADMGIQSAVDDNFIGHHPSPFAMPGALGSYRVKEEKARRLINWIEDAFMRRPLPPPIAPVEESQGTWSLGGAFAKFRGCCTSDPHMHERLGLNMEIQDLTHRRYVASQVLDEVEEEIKEIQRCLQERLQRRGALPGGHRSNSGMEVPGLDHSSILSGHVQVRSVLRDRLTTTENTLKRREAEMEKLYAAISNRQLDSVSLPMKGRRKARMIMAFDEAWRHKPLQVALTYWRFFLQERHHIDRLLLEMTKVLELCQHNGRASSVMEPLLQKLVMLRRKNPPAENWEVLSVWHWASAEVAQRINHGHVPHPAASQVSLHGALNQSRRPMSGMHINRQRFRLVRIFMWVFHRHNRFFLRVSFVGWAWTCSNKHLLHDQQQNYQANWQAPHPGAPVSKTASGRTWFNFWQQRGDSRVSTNSSARSHSAAASQAAREAYDSESGFVCSLDQPQLPIDEDTPQLDASAHAGVHQNLALAPPASTHNFHERGPGSIGQHALAGAGPGSIGQSIGPGSVGQSAGPGSIGQSAATPAPQGAAHASSHAAGNQQQAAATASQVNGATARRPSRDDDVDRHGGDTFGMDFDQFAPLPPPEPEPPAQTSSPNKPAGTKAAPKAGTAKPKSGASSAKANSFTQGPGAALAAKAKSKSTQQRQSKYTVYFNKSTGESLGLEVMQDEHGSVIIQAVSGGLAAAWNAEHAEAHIDAGDRLAEVNGVSEPEAMLHRCSIDEMLMITMDRTRRPPGSGNMTGPGGPGAAASPRAMGYQKFTVFFNKARGDSLGLDVAQNENGGVIIQSVNGGLAGRWNNENPGSVILPGDRIADVNGASDAQEMLERCKLASMLTITMERIVPH